MKVAIKTGISNFSIPVPSLAELAREHCELFDIMNAVELYGDDVYCFYDIYLPELDCRIQSSNRGSRDDNLIIGEDRFQLKKEFRTRSHPALLAAIYNHPEILEENGGDIKIIEVPEELDLHIGSVDVGGEWVYEAHRTWE